jgi:signal transduction histidine kinase
MIRMTDKQKKRHGPLKNTITTRWLVSNLGVVFLVLLIVELAVVYTLQHYYYNSAEQYLTTKISSVTAVLNRYAQDTDSNFSADLRSTFENFSDKDHMELMVINSKGRVTLTTSGFSPDANVAMPDYETAMEEERGTWVGTQNGERIMAVSVNISAIQPEYNAIRVVTSMTQIDVTLRNYTLLITAICAGVLLLLLLTGSFFVRSIVRPINRINAATKKFAQGDFSQRIAPIPEDEIGDLCKAVNDMASALSETDAMKNEFISSVSHELRTPLTAIQGWAETLCMDIDAETMQKGMHVIVNETERLSRMVEELLDFSRMQSGRLTLQPAPMDILAELGDAVLIYTEKAKREHIHLIYKEPEMLPFVYGDKNRIRQVFINVIDNALKYSNPNGIVTVSAEAIGNLIQVRISDNGVGISATDLPKVKTKFFKANHTRRGSGIGLAVADEIITMHKGRLEIHSELGAGTTVIIWLPAMPES